MSSLKCMFDILQPRKKIISGQTIICCQHAELKIRSFNFSSIEIKSRDENAVQHWPYQRLENTIPVVKLNKLLLFQMGFRMYISQF